MELKEMKFTIVGLGMVGGSYALAIKERINPKAVYGIDTNVGTLEKAQKKGIITNLSNKEILEDTDVLILAVYPSKMAEFFQENQKYLKSGTIVTDVGSVKSYVVDSISPILRDDIDFVYGHPMSGNQYSGFDYADINIFNNNNYIIIPQEKNKQENIDLVANLARAIGFKSVSMIDMQTHDKKIAYASHMMHFISVCVTNSPTFESSLDEFAGGSFRDLTRISDINPYLWSEVFFNNKDFLLSELDLFKENLEYLSDALKSDDYDRVFDFLEESRRRKSESKKLKEN